MTEYILYAQGVAKSFTDKDEAMEATYSLVNCFEAMSFILNSDELSMRRQRGSLHLLCYENKRLDLIILYEKELPTPKK